ELNAGAALDRAKFRQPCKVSSTMAASRDARPRTSACRRRTNAHVPDFDPVKKNPKRSIMRKSPLVASRFVASTFAATLLGCLLASAAAADTLSTSALAPSPVPASGVISGSFPSGGKETTYYLAVDLKAGDLATQISFMGRPGRDKSLELVLVDPSGRRAGGHYVMNGLGANGEQARV